MIEINAEEASKVKEYVFTALGRLDTVMRCGSFTDMSRAGIAIGLLASSLTHINAVSIPTPEPVDDATEEYSE